MKNPRMFKRWSSIWRRIAPAAIGIFHATASRRAFVLVISSFWVSFAKGQGPAWTEILAGPGQRHEFAMAFDSSRGRTVVFGGTKNGQTSNDTWEWDGAIWIEQHPTLSPPPRIHHAMAFDSSRSRIVLFGGLNFPENSVFQDTWEYDGVSWVQRNVSGPGPRLAHAMVYDATRQRVVLYGGQTQITSVKATSDTWEWDGSVWQQTCTNCSPSTRTRHAMAFDSARSRVVLFGGYDASGQRLLGTWEYDGTNWLDATPSGPNPDARDAHAMTYDAQLGRVILFGGYDGTSLFSDTWEWDGSNWTLGPLGPGPRWEHAIAYDSARCRVILYGGQAMLGGWPQLSDAWALGLPDSDGDGIVGNCDRCPGFNDAEPCPIPATSTWGLVFLALLVLGAGTRVLRRQQQVRRSTHA